MLAQHTARQQHEGGLKGAARHRGRQLAIGCAASHSAMRCALAACRSMRSDIVLRPRMSSQQSKGPSAVPSAFCAARGWMARAVTGVCGRGAVGGDGCVRVVGCLGRVWMGSESVAGLHCPLLECATRLERPAATQLLTRMAPARPARWVTRRTCEQPPRLHSCLRPLLHRAEGSDKRSGGARGRCARAGFVTEHYRFESCSGGAHLHKVDAVGQLLIPHRQHPRRHVGVPANELGGCTRGGGQGAA